MSRGPDRLERARPRYNRKGWPLTLCQECARPRYCEPHGTTWFCSRCSGALDGNVPADKLTESVSIPFSYGDATIIMSKNERLRLVADFTRDRVHEIQRRS